MANYAITQYALEMSTPDADTLLTYLATDWDEIPAVYIIDFYKTDYGVRFATETRWDQDTDFTDMIRKEFPSARLYYNVEETMSDLMYTNDAEGRYFPNRYFLDSENGDEEYFTNINSAAQYISKIVGRDIAPTRLK